MQFNSQSSSIPSQAGMGLGVQAPGLGTVSSTTLQQQLNSIHQQSNPQANPPALMASGSKEAGNLCFYFRTRYCSSNFCTYSLLVLFPMRGTLIYGIFELNIDR